jgi:dTDP-glucose 4,6-dehydratase
VSIETWIITGGAGFIGANFVRAVHASTDVRMVVVDKLTYAGNLTSLRDLAEDPRFQFVHADIADRDAMDHVLEQHAPTAVLNFAAESHVDRSIDGPVEFVNTNVLGTLQLLEATRAYLASRSDGARDAFRYLQVSTDEVFGSLGETGAFEETTPFSPRSPYSASKAGGDHLVLAYYETFGVPTLTTHCSNNYGPYQFPEKLIPLMLLNALEGKPLPIYGDGGNIRDWLYVEDHCHAILRVLEAATPGSTWNIGGRSERTNLQVIDQLCQEIETRRPARDNAALREHAVDDYRGLRAFVEDRPGHDRRYAINDTKLRSELGWEPSVTFEVGLGRTIDWYLANRDWCEAVQSGTYRRERLGTQSD